MVLTGNFGTSFGCILVNALVEFDDGLGRIARCLPLSLTKAGAIGTRSDLTGSVGAAVGTVGGDVTTVGCGFDLIFFVLVTVGFGFVGFIFSDVLAAIGCFGKSAGLGKMYGVDWLTADAFW